MDEQRYRQAELRLWSRYGLAPEERRIELAATDSSIRVQEVGAGDPVVLLHGGPNSGSTWAPLVRHLDGYRSIIVDRPGTGLSDDYVIRAEDLPRIGARFVPDLLDALMIDRAHVIASSFGGHLALRSAAAHPDRFDRMVQMASPAAVPGERYPTFTRVVRSRLGRRILGALPPNDRANRSIFRQIGHGASLDSGRMPEEILEWYLALGRYTNTMRNDSEMIGSVLNHLERTRLSEDLLRGVTVPTFFLWGEDDGFGGIDNGRRIADLLPHAELQAMPAAGHLPWLDDPDSAAHSTDAFLRRPARVDAATSAMTAAA